MFQQIFVQDSLPHFRHYQTLKELNNMVLTRKHKVVMVALACCLFLGFTLYEKVMTRRNVYVLSEANPVTAVDPAQANGLPAEQLEAVVDDPVMITVHIEGEVASPGVYELQEGARVNDLVLMAGGLTPEADRKINLAQKLQDEAFVYVPTIGEIPSVETAGNMAAGSPNIAFQPTATAQGSSLVNINTADQKSLETLAGIGPVLAERIIAHREEKGPFQQLQDLKNVTGIGDKRYLDIEKDITL